MRTPRRGLLALAAMAGAITTLLAPTAASAAYYGSETDYATYRSSFPDDDIYDECRQIDGVFGCYRATATASS